MNNDLMTSERSPTLEVCALEPDVFETWHFLFRGAVTKLFTAAWAFHCHCSHGFAAPLSSEAVALRPNSSGTYFILVTFDTAGPG
jgi:hypothetical protein